MINQPSPFKSRSIRIPIKIPINGEGVTNQGSTLSSKSSSAPGTFVGT